MKYFGDIIAALLLAGAIASGAAPSEASRTPEQYLDAGRAALEDELYAIAEKQLLACLREADGKLADEVQVKATDLLCRAMYAQGEYRQLLDALADGGVAGSMAGTDVHTFWLAAAHHAGGDPAKALSVLDGFEHTFKDSSYLPRALRVRAWSYRDTGATSNAIVVCEAFDKSFGESDDGPANLLDLAGILESAGQTNKAVATLSRLVALDSTNEVVQEGRRKLGVLQGALGQNDRALETLLALGTDTNAAPDVRADAWLRVAASQLAATNTAEAAASLKQAVDLARMETVREAAEWTLGEVLLETEDVDAGIELLKSRISAAPDDPRAERAQRRIAGVLLTRGRTEEATDEYQHYLESFTNSLGQAEAYTGRGRALNALGRHAEAAAAFTHAYELYPGVESRARALFRTGDAYFANEQFTLAAETYAGLVSELPESTLVPRSRYQEGESLAMAGDLDGAVAIFEQLAAERELGRFSEEAALRLAEIKESEEKWEEAVKAFSGVIDTCSNSTVVAQALLRRGLVRYRMFLFAESVEDFQRVTAEFGSTPQAEEAGYRLGLCHYWMGHDDKALASFRSFLKSYKSSAWVPDVLFWLGKYAFNRGDFEEAEETFLRVSQAAPEEHELCDDSILWAGRAAAKRKEYVRAIELFGSLVKNYPQSPRIAEARFAQGEALCELADYSGAILIFDEIITRYPDSELVPSAWGRKGDCQFTLGAEDPARYRESIESYRVVASQAGSQSDAILHAEYKIGRSMEKLGLADEAFEQYYVKVIVRYLEDAEKGVWHNESAKVWFARAAFNAADIMEDEQNWRRATRVLQRIVDAKAPGSEQAEARIRELRTEHWWLFY